MKKLPFLFLLPLAVWAEDKPPAKPGPSKVENAVAEAALPTLRITPEAEKRLGLVYAEVTSKPMPEARLFAGEVVLPLAGEGRLTPAPANLPEEYRRLADQQADADGKIAEAQASLKAAEAAVRRAEQMLIEKAGSQRAFDEATAQLELTSASKATAEARRKLLGPPAAEFMRSPQRWVRVSVSSTELAMLEASAPASVFSQNGEAKPLAASPIQAPPSANSLAGTVDWYYSLAEAKLAPGLRVQASIPRKGPAAVLVAPWSAVIFDATGGSWLYEQTAPQTFVRRRVMVARVAGQEAVLAHGGQAGMKVVSVGVAELFGAEFGNGK